MAARMLYIHALSPLHTGTGQSVGVVDLPVAREKVLTWPYLPGSSLKGVLRDACEAIDGASTTLAFGPKTENASDHAGALWFSDGHLLCLPVRSYFGSFAWVTCPMALRRWQRDGERAGLGASTMEIPPVKEAEALVASGSEIAQGNQVYLEDYDLRSREVPAVQKIGQLVANAVFSDTAWQTIFLRRLVVVADDLFTFLAETGTEVTARVQLKDDTKTVKDGALWYEESVPAEAIFTCPVVVAPRQEGDADEFFRLLGAATARTLQVGGKASVGRGLVSLRLREG